MKAKNKQSWVCDSCGDRFIAPCGKSPKVCPYCGKPNQIRLVVNASKTLNEYETSFRKVCEELNELLEKVYPLEVERRRLIVLIRGYLALGGINQEQVDVLRRMNLYILCKRDKYKPLKGIDCE